MNNIYYYVKRSNFLVMKCLYQLKMLCEKKKKVNLFKLDVSRYLHQRPLDNHLTLHRKYPIRTIERERRGENNLI